VLALTQIFFCILHGKKGTTAEIPLLHSDHTNKFEAGQVDTFPIGNPDLGGITHITVRSDNSGAGSDWLLERIDVIDEATGEQVKALCGIWYNKKLLEQKFPLS